MSHVMSARFGTPINLLVKAIPFLVAIALYGPPTNVIATQIKNSVGGASLRTNYPEKVRAPLREPISPIGVPTITNPEEVQLGRRLFKDKRLSKDNSIACSSCHILTQGGDDGRAFSVGVEGKLGIVNAPTVLNSSLNIAQFWDGRASSLADQVSGPIQNPLEMASHWDQVIHKLSADEGLVTQFQSVYGQGPNPKNVKRAIAAYEERLLTIDAPFDKYLRGWESAISPMAKEGYLLFKRLGCISCHQGKNVGGNMFQVFGATKNYFAGRRDIRTEDLGRYNVTGRESDRYKFKVPSLRNIAETAPYFHDGSVETLEEAVRVMAEFQLGRPISDENVERIVAFLHSLTGRLMREVQ